MNGIFASGRTKNVIEYHFKEVNFVITLFQLPANVTNQTTIRNEKTRRYLCSLFQKDKTLNEILKNIKCTWNIFSNWIEKYKLVNKHYIAKHICSINISKQCIDFCSHAILNCILIWLYAVQIGRIYYLYDYVHILEFLIRRNKYFLEFQLKEVLMVFEMTFGTKTWLPSIILAKNVIIHSF